MTRVLIFNFFGGVIDRGIPVYAQDIAECMRRVGFEPLELRCPPFLRRAPRLLRNLLFVVFEQLVAPAVRILRGCAVTVYPYNSVGLVDAVAGRSILVVHDLISNKQTNKRLAARYIRFTQSAQRSLGRPVCAASEHTLVHLRRLEAFRRCPLELWANPFYLFEEALAQREDTAGTSRSQQLHVLLCSGMGPNKDFGGALRLFTHSRVLTRAKLRVIGFGDDAHLAARRVTHLPEAIRERIIILPRLSLAEVVSEYLRSDLVWVHSEKEGFGRSLIEGRLSGRPVVASNIPAFSKLRGRGVHLYRNTSFDADVKAALECREPLTCLCVSDYHARLQSAVRDVVTGTAFVSDLAST